MNFYVIEIKKYDSGSALRERVAFLARDIARYFYAER